MRANVAYCRKALLAGLLGAALMPVAVLAASEAAPTARTCPSEIKVAAQCYTGQDSAGAFYWIAIPRPWNQVLVMHAHGGPADAGPARLERSEEDLQRWALMPNLGYAWAGSTYRRGGYGVTMAAEDTERLRQIFVQNFGQPRRTLLHGQSYGGGVAAKAAELYAKVNGQHSPYDGVLLTSGVLGGGVQAYQFRYVLRQAYQAECQNHPLPNEPQYPLWMGLPAGASLTRAQLAQRVQECTGLGLPAAQRSDLQKARLARIAQAAKIQERSLLSHLVWATWLFEDLVQRRLDGSNPFSPGADPQAVATLNLDSSPTGKVNMPILTLHAIDDPTAFVELESVYREALTKAGNADLLVQTFSAEHEHSYLVDTEYATLLESLMAWVDEGKKPTPQTIAERCKGLESVHQAACQFRPDYQPVSLVQRVAPNR